MKLLQYKYKQTSVTVLVDEEKYYRVAIDAIMEARREIELMIREDPLFLTSLEPYDIYSGQITKRMVRASKLAGVGPMASVAGVIAQYAVEKMIEEGAEFAVVDNGGDIAIFTDRELVIGVYAGRETRIGFKIKPSREIIAVCTSSGTVGHSISFGFADAATVFCDDACIADAFATALGNEIKENFGEKEVMNALENFWKRASKHVDGIFAIKGRIIGFAGRIPEIVKAEVNPDLITKG